MRGAVNFVAAVAFACNASAPPPEAPIVIAIADAGPSTAEPAPAATPAPVSQGDVDTQSEDDDDALLKLMNPMGGPDPRATRPAPSAAGGRPFDRGTAAQALGGVNVQTCKRPGGPTGAGHVKITFDPAGRVSAAVVDAGPFPGTPVGACIMQLFGRVRIPSFTGAPVSVGKSFTIN